MGTCKEQSPLWTLLYQLQKKRASAKIILFSIHKNLHLVHFNILFRKELKHEKWWDITIKLPIAERQIVAYFL